VGYKASIVIGLLVAGVGALAFYPAAKVPSYALFLLALCVLATGITLLQVAANPYISLIGDPRYASSRLTLAQALNSLGTTLAPSLIGPLILSVGVLGAQQIAQLEPAQAEAYRIAQAGAVQGPYLGIAVGLAVLAMLVYLLRLPPLTEAREDPSAHTLGQVLRHPQLRFGVIAIFVYVGAEVGISSFLINYLEDARIGALDAVTATKYVSYYWGGAMVGRFLGSALMRRISPHTLLCLFALAAIALLITTMATVGAVAMWSVVAIGLFNSIMFPTLFTFGIEGLGTETSKASSLLVMAIFGGAVIPVLMGKLADRIGVQPSFIVPVLCYAYIAWYALRGGPRRAPAGGPAAA
jgi:FHS family L-fucose permease-like MFS transporter